MVDDDRIRVGYVQAVLDYGGAKQQVVVAPDEVEHLVFELLGGHLAMGNAYPHVGHQAAQNLGYALELLDVVMEEEDLPAAAHLVLDYGLDFLLVEEDYLGLDGDAVGRRGGDDAQVARAEQRELQGARDRGGRERESIDLRAKLAQLFLRRHAELLFFVDDQQPEVLEREAVAKQLVGADDDVDGPVGQFLLDRGQFLRGAQAADVVDPDGERGQARAEGGEVLQREDGSRHEHGDLLTVGGGLERCADGYFRLTEAHVAADQAVHGEGLLHVVLHGAGGLLLVRGVLVHERRLELGLQVRIGREGEALGRTALGVELNQLLRYILNLVLRAVFKSDPCLRAELIDAWRLTVGRTEAGNLMEGVDRDENDVAVFVGQFHDLLHTAIVILDAHQAAEHADAMVDVDYVVPYIERAEVVERELLGLFDRTAYGNTMESVEDFMVGVVAYLVFFVDEAVMDVLTVYKFRQGASFLVQNSFKPVGLRLLFSVNQDFIAAFDF